MHYWFLIKTIIIIIIIIIKTLFFDTCQMTVKSCVLHLFTVPQTGSSHIINILLALSMFVSST